MLHRRTMLLRTPLAHHQVAARKARHLRRLRVADPTLKLESHLLICLRLRASAVPRIETLLLIFLLFFRFRGPRVRYGKDSVRGSRRRTDLSHDVAQSRGGYRRSLTALGIESLTTEIAIASSLLPLRIQPDLLRLLRAFPQLQLLSVDSRCQLNRFVFQQHRSKDRAIFFTPPALLQAVQHIELLLRGKPTPTPQLGAHLEHFCHDFHVAAHVFDIVGLRLIRERDLLTRSANPHYSCCRKSARPYQIIALQQVDRIPAAQGC